MASLTFQALPFDVHFEVAKHLDYKSILKFKATNRYFYRNINPHTALPSHVQDEFLKKADMFKRNATLWACFCCHQMLSIDCFGNSMRKAKSGARGEALTRSAGRYCWDCAAKKRVYAHLGAVKKGALLYYLCHHCGRYETKSRKCGVTYVTKDGVTETIPVCFTEQVPVIPLELLSAKLLQNIVQHVGYRDALYLAATSRELRKKVQPLAWVSLHKRYQFVRRKWESENAVTPGPSYQDIYSFQNLPCYGCFRIRPADRFTRVQLDFSNLHPKHDWKRRCQSCVATMYVTPSNDLLREFRRRRGCGVCGSIKLKDETCHGCLEKLVAGEIDEIPVDVPLDNKVYLGEYLDAVAELFSQAEEQQEALNKVRNLLNYHPSIVDMNDAADGYVRLKKFQRHFWRGDMTATERSIYARISTRVQDRRRGHSVFFGSFARRLQSLVHRGVSDLQEVSG